MTPEQIPPDWLQPHWPAAPHVRAVFTGRQGGASRAPFDRFNLGDHVGDDPAAVTANRAHLAAITDARPVFLQQVHGVAVHHATEGSTHGAVADAVWADQPGVACTIMVADCLPILLCDRAGTWVAAAHAGWRGLANGVIEATLATVQEAMRAKNAAKIIANDAPNDTLAWLGPCIGPRAFEVGAEVRDAFVQHDPQAECAFIPGAAGMFWADLPLLARQRLAACGVTAVSGNDGSDAWCTHTQAARWFSHRRDAKTLGSTGRMAAAVWLQA